VQNLDCSGPAETVVDYVLPGCKLPHTITELLGRCTCRDLPEISDYWVAQAGEGVALRLAERAKFVAGSHLAGERPEDFLADAATRSFASLLRTRHCTLD